MGKSGRPATVAGTDRKHELGPQGVAGAVFTSQVGGRPDRPAGMGSAFRSARRGIASNETPPSRPLRSTTAAALFSRLIGRLRGDALPGRGPKHVGVFLALGDADARDVWFFGHEDKRFGKNVAIAPGPRRDRGGRRRESDGIDAAGPAAGVRRTRASRLRRLFRAAISGNSRLKPGSPRNTRKARNGGGGPLLRRAYGGQALNSRKPRKIEPLHLKS